MSKIRENWLQIRFGRRLDQEQLYKRTIQSGKGYEATIMEVTKWKCAEIFRKLEGNKKA